MIAIGFFPSKLSFSIITKTLDICFEIFRSTEVLHFIDPSYRRYLAMYNACWKATFVVLNFFSRLSGRDRVRRVCAHCPICSVTSMTLVGAVDCHRPSCDSSCIACACVAL